MATNDLKLASLKAWAANHPEFGDTVADLESRWLKYYQPRGVMQGIVDRGQFPTSVPFRDPTPASVAVAASPMATNQLVFDEKWMPTKEQGKRIFSAVVVNVRWSDIQPNSDGFGVGSALVSNSIDTAITAVRAWNTANPDRPLSIVVRISGAWRAPGWVATYCGHVIMYDTSDAGPTRTARTVPIWWNNGTDKMSTCYGSLLTEFQARYGAVEEIASVSYSRGSNAFPECMLHYLTGTSTTTGAQDNWTNLEAAGLTDALDQAAWLAGIQQHADLLPSIRTRVAYNPYERFRHGAYSPAGSNTSTATRLIGTDASPGTGFASGTTAATLMAQATTILGDRHIIEIDNLRPTYLDRSLTTITQVNDQAVLERAAGKAFGVQTATAANIEGDWQTTVAGCIALGATSVETLTDYYDSITVTADAVSGGATTRTGARPWTDTTTSDYASATQSGATTILEGFAETLGFGERRHSIKSPASKLEIYTSIAADQSFSLGTSTFIADVERVFWTNYVPVVIS